MFRDNADRNDFLTRLVEITSKSQTRCYAWALLPNHFHLLLRTGAIPITASMQRLLTGYAATFNHRHNRHGHLFQNRYKSILCHADTYLLELVRYIHLNPLRAGIVSSLGQLRSYPYCGHSCIMGLNSNFSMWMDVQEILQHFGGTEAKSRTAYESFVAEGVQQGRRSELTGGGLLRSAGGWREVIAAREYGIFLKSDERILGDSDFVDLVLNTAGETFDRKSVYCQKAIDVDALAEVIAAKFGIAVKDLWAEGRQRKRVEARSLFCYWAVRELGESATSLSRRLGISQPAVSLSVSRGEQLAAEKGWELEKLIDEQG
ncbi:transposase [Geomonas sp. RF6]|uniref:transposase n=1 Tax=Geomonas sp. RF6 TaxID=2897342 RepID=UPI001E51C49D|nr:transposase [Geomonas sp. RF6]UFS72787.1 transposase [Geomonas sp. RF6]